MGKLANRLIAAWSAAATPPPRLTVSEWAESKRILPETSGSRGGAWRNAAAPYLTGIMDAVHEPTAKTIAVMKGAQLGGSEALHNILGYFIEHDPCPMLFVHPTAMVAEEWSKDRLGDMIRTTPALRAVVRDKRQPRGSGEAESTLSLKMFPGGFLALGGANTPNTFARRAVRIAFGDDVDRFPPVVGEEGDPLDLLRNRTRTFYNGLVFAVSTPTLKGGRIDTLYARSDQRRYLMPCPCCGREDWITWRDPQHFRVVYEGGDAETARLACPDPEYGGCGGRMTEPERRAMVAAGRWTATAEPKEAGLVGFHLPAMLSTLGDVTLATLVEQWQSARAKGKESLRVFINTTLAEGWEDRGARVEAHTLLARREVYTDAQGQPVEVPAWAAALTAGVDVQEDRFEVQVQAWGPGGERAVVGYHVVPGNIKKQPGEASAALIEALQRRYLHASGHQLPIHATCIDSGYATDEVYDFVLAYQVKRIFATKGIAGRSGEPIVGKATEKRYGKKPRPVRLWPVNTDDAKADVMMALTLAAPGPGYMHFPLGVDAINEEYFAQLCAEHKETRYNRAGVATHIVWEQDRTRNEALDTAVLCLAAYRLLNPNVRQMAEVLASTPVPGAPQPKPATPAPVAAPTPRPQAQPVQRVSHSSYLSR